jgi:hypothetical protein
VRSVRQFGIAEVLPKKRREEWDCKIYNRKWKDLLKELKKPP